MGRRFAPASKTDDLRFAVRVKFAVPDMGMGPELDRLHEWLRANIGSGNFAVHSAIRSGGSAVAVHLRKPADAVRLAKAFPQLELANS